MVLQPFNIFVCAFQGTERWTSKSSLLQVLISIQGKYSCQACGAGKGRGRKGSWLMGGTELASATPAGLVLPFALTLLDKAVSSLHLSSGRRCQLFSCPEFWLHPRALTQCFPFFSLQQPSTELSACYSELTGVNHRVLSQLPKLVGVAKLGLVRRTFFYPH